MPELNIEICPNVEPLSGLTFYPAHAPYSEYVKVDCPRCQKAMWLGSRGRAELEAGRAEIICVACAIATGLYTGPATPVGKLTDRDS